MAEIIRAGVTSSHIPAVGNAIANHQTQEPYWEAIFRRLRARQGVVAHQRPDVAIVIYNDHGLNFFWTRGSDLRARLCG